MSYREAVATAAGSRPSSAVGIFLDQFMLPGEPVAAALKGTIRLTPVWLVATPAVVVLLRDGMSMTIEAAATPTEGILWQAEESWGDTKLHLELAGQRLTMSQVNPRRLNAFLNELDFLFSSMPDGWPPGVSRSVGALDTALVAAVAAAPLRDPEELNRMIAVDFSRILFDGVNSHDELTFELALLIFVTALARPDVTDLSRRGIVDLAVRDGNDVEISNLGTVLAFRGANGPDGERWREAVDGLSQAVSSAMLLLAPGAQYARSLLHASAEALRTVAAQRAELSGKSKSPSEGPVGTGQPLDGDLLGTLERLQKLRDAGAITADEFADLKRRALGA